MHLQLNGITFEGHPRSHFYVCIPRLFEWFWSPRTGERHLDWLTAKAKAERKAAFERKKLEQAEG